jgi:hypothetical protein
VREEGREGNKEKEIQFHPKLQVNLRTRQNQRQGPSSGWGGRRQRNRWRKNKVEQ